MATDRQVKVTLTLSADQYKAELDKAQKATSKLADEQDHVGKSARESAQVFEEAAKRQEAAVQMVGTGLVAAGTAVGVLGAAMLKTGIEYNTLQQTTRAALTTLLGSAEAAGDQMDRLDEFARNSPFAKQVFIQAQQQMLGFGVAAQDVIPALDAIQNTVAAFGGSNEQIAAIAEIMSRIKSEGRLSGDALQRLGYYGVDAAQLIGDEMGMTAGEIREMASRPGGIPVDQIWDPLVNGMQNKFGGAADNVKNTFAGALDRVKAAWRDLSASLAEPLVGSEGGGLFVDLANDAADLMRTFEALPGPAKTAAVVLVGLGGAAAFLQGTLLLLGPKIDEAKTKFGELATGGAKSAVAMSAIAAVGAAGLMAWSSTLDDSNTTLKGTVDALALAAAGFAVGGPWGAAVGGGIGLLKMFGGETVNVQGDVKALTATLDEQSGAVTKASAEWASNQIISSGAADVFDEVGLSVANVTDAILGDIDAQQKVAAALDGGGKSAFQASMLYAELGGQVDDAKTAHKESAEAMQESTAVSEDLSAAIKAQTDEWLANAEAQMGATNAAIAQVEAQIAANEAIAGGAQIVRDAAGAVDLNVESSRNAESALGDLAGANLANVQAMKDAEVGSAELDAALATQRQSFIDTAMRMGYTAEEAAALADRYGQIPQSIPTTVSISKAAGFEGAYADIKNRLAELTSPRSVAVSVAPLIASVIPGLPGQRKATGGSVIGPGTGTSDSIPALLSNGEHVLTAAEVRAMGGQENVYRFRRSLHAYADGGAVDYRAAARASFATGGAVTGVVGGSTVIENHFHVTAPSGTNEYQLATLVAGETAFVARGSGQGGN